MHTLSKLNILGSNKFIITRNFSYNISGILGRLPSKLVKVHSRSSEDPPIGKICELLGSFKILKDLCKIHKGSLKVFDDLQRSLQGS